MAGDDEFPELDVPNNQKVNVSCHFCLLLRKYHCYYINLPLLAENLKNSRGELKFESFYIHSKINKQFEVNNGNVIKGKLLMGPQAIHKSEIKSIFCGMSLNEITDYLIMINDKNSYEKNIAKPLVINNDKFKYANTYSKPKFYPKLSCMANLTMITQDDTTKEGDNIRTTERTVSGAAATHNTDNSQVVDPKTINNDSAIIQFLTNKFDALEAKYDSMNSEFGRFKVYVVDQIEIADTLGHSAKSLSEQLHKRVDNLIKRVDGANDSQQNGAAGSREQPRSILKKSNGDRVVDSTHINNNTVATGGAPHTQPSLLAGGLSYICNPNLPVDPYVLPTIPLSQPGINNQTFVASSSAIVNTTTTSRSVNAPIPSVHNINNTTFNCESLPDNVDLVSIIMSHKNNISAAAASAAASNNASANNTNNNAGDNGSNLTNSVGNFNYGHGFSKKIILAPYGVGQKRKFRQFLEEFEAAARGTGQVIGAWPIILADHLEESAKAHYRNCYIAGMTYQALRHRLLVTFENLEQVHRYPVVASHIVFNRQLGTYGLLMAIMNDLDDFGDSEPIRQLTNNEFWRRLPKDMLTPFKATLSHIALKTGMAEADLNCLMRASMAYDRSNLFVNQYLNDNVSEQTPVPPPPQPTNFSRMAAGVQTHVPSGRGSAHAETQESAAPPRGGLNQRRPYGGQRGGYGRGAGNYASPRGHWGGVGNYQGFRGGYQTRSNYRGGAGYRGGQGSGPSPNFKCWTCGLKGHYLKDCPKVDTPFKPIKCSLCGRVHARNYDCQMGQAQTSALASVAGATAATQPIIGSTQNTLVSTTEASSTPNSQCKFVNTNNKSINKKFNKHKVGINQVGINVVRAIRWSQFTELDQISDNDFNYLPMEDIEVSFQIYQSSKDTKIIKHNRNTFFLKDMPQKGNELFQDAKNKFNTANKLLSKARRIHYPCASRTCKYVGHFVQDHNDNNEFQNKVLDAIRDEFPLCTISESDDSRRQEFESKVELFNKVDKFGMPTCTILANSQKNIFKNEDKRLPHPTCWDLEFNNEDLNRPCEINEPVFKINKYEWEHEGLRVSAMKDLMLINLNIGQSSTLHAMLDTGASMSILNHLKRAQVGGQWQKANSTTIMGIGDKKGTIPFKSEPLTLSFGGIQLAPFSFYSLPEIDIGYDVILGRDFLNQYDIRLFPAIRKIRVGCKLGSGERSVFSVFQSVEQVQNSNSSDNGDNMATSAIGDFTCIEVPCYLNKDVDLVADQVNSIHILPDKSFIIDENILKNNNLITYLELDETIVGLYPNIGIVNSNFSSQSIGILSSVDRKFKKGDKIGYFKTALAGSLPDNMSNDWSPNDYQMYSIMSDQEIAEALNSAKRSDKVSNNPNAVIDEVPRWGNLPMSETPDQYKLGNARVYPPRDMEEFDRLHEEWKHHRIPDAINDTWTYARIKR